MEITVKYHVGKMSFSSQDAAEQYIVENKDLARIAAFADYLRANNQRSTSYMEDRLLCFIGFENGTDPLNEEEEDTPETASAPAETPVEDEEVETPTPEEEAAVEAPEPAEIDEVEEEPAAPSKSLFDRP